MFGSAVVDQGLLSAASLAVGLLLIRNTADVQYGYYVLVANAFLLLTSLQNAFIGPAMVIRMSSIERNAHGALIGGLFRGQRRLVLGIAAGALALAGALWAGGVLDRFTGPLVLVAVIVGVLALNRDFFRLVLLAHRESVRLLRANLFYAALLVLGAALAVRTEQAAIVAVATLGVAAAIGGLLMYLAVRQHCAWDPKGPPGVLRSLMRMGLWSVAGAAIHWTFSQGYSYVVAGVLDVTAVAALAATRLLMMPINLLSTGISSLIFPLTSGWLQQRSVSEVVRRLLMFAGGIGLAALCYFAIMWVARDWLFSTVLRKEFADRDTLLLMWSAIFLLMVMRDQLIPLLLARARFRELTGLTLATAVLALALSYWGMLHLGQTGALLGMLAGEGINLSGILILVLLERTRPAGEAP